MKISEYSKVKFYKSFDTYRVAKDFADPMYNYLVYGYSPGGFFTAVLANDFMGAMPRCHPANTVQAIKNLVVWIINELQQGICWGSYDVVDAWLKVPAEERRAFLEQKRLIYTEADEIIMTLKASPIEDILLHNTL